MLILIHNIIAIRKSNITAPRTRENLSIFVNSELSALANNLQNFGWSTLSKIYG